MNIIKHSFDETFMSAGDALVQSEFPGFGSSNRTASTSRVERTPAKAVTPKKQTRKGLSRACVLVVREDARNFKVFVKGSGALLGTVRRCSGSKGKAYSYKLVREDRSHAGFGSQKAAIERMLEKS
jgi:hypothetical protein